MRYFLLLVLLQTSLFAWTKGDITLKKIDGERLSSERANLIIEILEKNWVENVKAKNIPKRPKLKDFSYESDLVIAVGGEDLRLKLKANHDFKWVKLVRVNDSISSSVYSYHYDDSGQLADVLPKKTGKSYYLYVILVGFLIASALLIRKCTIQPRPR